MQKILPDLQRIITLREEGKTYQQIADWLEEKHGVKVSAGSIGSALSRGGVTKARPRYKDHLPWTVAREHTTHYAARMLRLMGRRDDGGELTEEELDRLNSWLAKLKKEHAVVVYVPDTEEGFYYVDGEPNRKGIPILKPR